MQRVLKKYYFALLILVYCVFAQCAESVPLSFESLYAQQVLPNTETFPLSSECFQQLFYDWEWGAAMADGARDLLAEDWTYPLAGGQGSTDKQDDGLDPGNEPSIEDDVCLEACSKHSDRDLSDDSAEEEPSQKMGPRVQALLQCLKERKVCFKDVKRTLYLKGGISAFQEDILLLLRNNIDVRQEGTGFTCGGELMVDRCPSEHVSEAMFKLLCASSITAFDMRFALYRKGYIDCSRDFLLRLEIALVIGDVHPHGQEINVKRGGVGMNKKLKDVWRKVNNYSRPALTTLLNGVYARSHEFYLNPFYKGVLWVLWKLKESKQLDNLVRLKDACKKQGETFLAPTHSHRKAQIFMILQDRKNQAHMISDLMGLIQPDGAKCGIQAVLQSSLLLALDGLPIVYNRDLQELTLLDTATEAKNPKEGTNFLTMLYDLARQYKTALFPEEIAYYAKEGGYWEQDSSGRVLDRRELFQYIDEQQEALVIQGYIEVDRCLKKIKNNIDRKKMLWPRFIEDDQDHGLPYYRKFCRAATNKDLEGLRALRTRIKQPDFTVFKNYVSSRTDKYPVMTGEQFVKFCLCKRGYTFSDLLRLCHVRDMKALDLWEVAGTLTCQEEGGRLLYCPAEDKFTWDDEGQVPHPLGCAYVARTFALKRMYAGISNNAVVHMLRQEGFDYMTLNKVNKVLRGLETLGLCARSNSITPEGLAMQRRLLNAMLDETAKPNPQKNKYGVVTWQWQIAEIVYSWQDNKTMELLLQTYAEGDGADGAPEDVSAQVSSQVSAPPAKRQKLEEGLKSFEHIVYDEIPRLYTLLCRKGIWPNVQK